MNKKTQKPVIFSALEVANICGVVNQTAINWIHGGFLKAFKTPGGQYRVYPDDLAAFMSSRNMHIPESLLAVCKDRSAYVLNTLLIVDDDRGLNAVIAKFLEKQFPTINILQAYDGFEAGYLMTNNHPQCLILDLDLPGVDGFAICQRISEGKAFGNPLVIVITALPDPTIEERVQALGVTHFFRKPLVLEDLTAVIKSVYR
jgi:CheY-like chemotaxis protein